MKNIAFLTVFILLFSALSLGCDNDDAEPDPILVFKQFQAHYQGKWYCDEYCFTSDDIYAIMNPGGGDILYRKTRMMFRR